MATITDDFNRANENPLASPWVSNVGDMELYVNKVIGSSFVARNVFSWDSGDTAIGADQYAQVKCLTVYNSGRNNMVCVRCAGSGVATFYSFNGDDASSLIEKVVAGTPTTLQGSGSGFSADDVIRLEVSGTSLTAKINGVTTLTTTDSAIASGQPGIGLGYDHISLNTSDDFEGGDLASGLSIPMAMSYYEQQRRK